MPSCKRRACRLRTEPGCQPSTVAICGEESPNEARNQTHRMRSCSAWLEAWANSTANWRFVLAENFWAGRILATPSFCHPSVCHRLIATRYEGSLGYDEQAGRDPS